jgi:hypothetical protein
MHKKFKKERMKPAEEKAQEELTEPPPCTTPAQESFTRTLDQLFQIARAICKDIVLFQPDLVIALAHGGWAPLRAAQALWNETRPTPFPPVLVTNLGRENLDRYDRIRASVPCVNISPFVADYAGNHEIVYFLAWLTQQTDWQDELFQQVLDALGSDQPPDRILVIDDTIWEGGTFRLA